MPRSPFPRSLFVRSTPALLLALTASCASERPSDDWLARMDERHQTLLAEQEVFEADFVARNPMPARLELDGKGEILVRDCRLDGRLGKEELIAHLTYVNTSGTPIREGRIYLAVRDPESGLQHEVSEDMFLPFGLRFYANSTYTTTLRLPTQGLHRRTGWEWKAWVEVIEAVPYEE